MSDSFCEPAAANVIWEQTFKCIKCGDELEYSEFVEAPDPKMDYGYYVMEYCVHPIGVCVVDRISLCSPCVRVINVGTH